MLGIEEEIATAHNGSGEDNAGSCYCNIVK